jgi:hypothetical protein
MQQLKWLNKSDLLQLFFIHSISALPVLYVSLFLLYSTATVKVAVPKSARIIIEGNSGTVGVGVGEGVGFSTENRKGEDVASKNRFPPK